MDALKHGIWFQMCFDPVTRFFSKKLIFMVFKRSFSLRVIVSDTPRKVLIVIPMQVSETFSKYLGEHYLSVRLFLLNAQCITSYSFILICSVCALS